MLTLGIILTVLGFIVFHWAAAAQSEPVSFRPMIFQITIAVIIINLVWIGLLIGGFYSLWQVSPKIVLTIIGIYAVLCIFGYFTGSGKAKEKNIFKIHSQLKIFRPLTIICIFAIFAIYPVLCIFGYFTGSGKAKAKNIFKIYKQLKIFRPKATDEEIFRETINVYFRGLRWDEHETKRAVDTIFKESGSKDGKDIKDIARFILIFENPYSSKSMKDSSKQRKSIDDAYNAIIGNVAKVTERPKLSKNTTEFIKSIGFNVDEMTNEQLAVFSEMDDPGKSNWAVQVFYVTSGAFLILSGFNLISLKLDGFLANGFISFVVWYIGYKIQMKRISKKFYEVNIMKYAQEQAEK